MRSWETLKPLPGFHASAASPLFPGWGWSTPDPSASSFSLQFFEILLLLSEVWT